jgi:cytochrome c-type biogenesis protein CcmH/NrfF
MTAPSPGALALTEAAERRRKRLVGSTRCPTCRGTGIAHSAPYIVGMTGGDLYSMTACERAKMEDEG